uniref:Nuclear protein MDM1 n=1 Tax=Diabrotica virgifera virgifera TaxID=50390 RepID=A0A6P7GUV7_DIAVI
MDIRNPSKKMSLEKWIAGEKPCLHSEYRSTYRWHEYTGPRQEVVRRPPQTNVSEKTNDINEAKINEDDFHASETMHKPEPAMPRRKKYPDLAYRHTEFISSDRANDFNSADRARTAANGALGELVNLVCNSSLSVGKGSLPRLTV